MAGINIGQNNQNLPVKHINIGLNGSNVKIKQVRWGNPATQTNVVVWNEYDCKAHNYDKYFIIDANGAVGNFTAVVYSGGIQVGFSLIFDNPISFIENNTLAIVRCTYSNQVNMLVYKDRNALNPLTNTTYLNNGEYNLIANQSGSLNEFYFAFQTSVGTQFDSPNSAITIGGIQINNVELI